MFVEWGYVEEGDGRVEVRNLPLGVLENLSSVLVAMQRLAPSTQRFHFIFSHIRDILFMLLYTRFIHSLNYIASSTIAYSQECL